MSGASDGGAIVIGNPSAIRNEGYKVLVQGLGVAGAVMFLRQIEDGTGNYTEERRSALEQNSINSIAARIKKRKAPSN